MSFAFKIFWSVAAVALVATVGFCINRQNATQAMRDGVQRLNEKIEQESKFKVSFLELQKNHLKLLSSIPSKRIEIYEFTDPANGERMIVVFKGDQVAITPAQPPL